MMRTIFTLVVVMAVLVSCSSDNRRNADTGMVEGGAGGLSTRDTIPSGAAGSTRRDSTATTAVDSSATASSAAAILSQMNVANTTEIQLATLAAKKASSPKVKQIAGKLATDHSKNREQLRALAQRLNVTLTPAQGGSVSAADSAAMPPDLQGKSGRNFDRAFVQHEIADHQSNIQKLQTQAIPSAQDAAVKAYLQKTVTEMQAHLSSLKQVQQQLGS
jgi:putative membrane protein